MSAQRLKFKARVKEGTSLSRKKSTSIRMRFPFGLLLPLRLARASSAWGSWRLNNLRRDEELHYIKTTMQFEQFHDVDVEFKSLTGVDKT